ncbi:hypothetical protein GWO43_21185 [candidate division KSB1 bacterium]|nr:hypothetical protein [candidate division KSB1 bacterium]NIR72068.1 hypothetical protein [candidate division KSB1 bacterium]NIS26579.1 hypothetical protein [candidate division KSB1 bacterium]NIT73341.1 hypothetical protein [candidate division KSB1 bacterium]NIU27189.1 hypothetical protein [candidate division KSB1 bacterium]
MNTVRLNITLPKDTAARLEKFSGHKSKSAFIAECIRFRIDQIEKEDLKKALEEGYKNTRSESLELAKEFEAADIEGWDEY